MSEILKYEGKLQRTEMELRKVELKMRGRLLSMRELLDPTEKLEDLQGEIIANQALELASLQIQQKEFQAEIREIKRLLGR